MARYEKSHTTIEAVLVDEEGATTIESGLLAAFIATGIITTVTPRVAKMMELYNTGNSSLP